MQPVIHEWLSGIALALRQLALVVREDVVHAARMYVEARPQVLHRHRATLDVPTGEAAPPRAIPGHLATRLGQLPEGEVFGLALLVRRTLAGALEQTGKLIARQ